MPLALWDGGLLLAAGSALVELDADGVVRARGSLEERTPAQTTERAVGAVVDSPNGALVTTASGSVYRFRPPAAPRKIGSLGGNPGRGGMLADDRTLVAVVDSRRVVALDLLTGTTYVRGGGLVFDGPPALGPGGVLLVGTQVGILLGFDAAGNEKVHVMLDKAPPVAPGSILVASPQGLPSTFLGAAELKPSPPVVVDAAGRVAFARSSGRVGLVSPEGKVALAGEHVCPSPVGVLPAGDKRLLVACHDGGLWMYGE
jgi:hypothetical protein